MLKFKFTIDRESLQTMYTSFIRPSLEYVDSVWDNITQIGEKELEQNKTQIEAARILLCATPHACIPCMIYVYTVLLFLTSIKIHVCPYTYTCVCYLFSN